MSYIIVVEDSPQYFWCEDRAKKNMLTKVESTTRRKGKNEIDVDNFALIQDEYVQLKSVSTEDKKVKYSWSAVDRAAEWAIINLFYAPPHYSEIPIEWFNDLTYINHKPLPLMPNSRKRANPYTQIIEKRQKTEEDDDEINFLLGEKGFRTGPSMSFIMVRKSTNCGKCDPDDAPDLMLPYFKLYQFFKQCPRFFIAYQFDDICLQHGLGMPGLLNKSANDWIKKSEEYSKFIKEAITPIPDLEDFFLIDEETFYCVGEHSKIYANPELLKMSRKVSDS